FDGIVVAHAVPAGDGVVVVIIQRIPDFNYPGSPTFGRNRVAAHGVNLGDHGHAEFGIGLGHGNRGSKAGATAADQQNIVVGDVHKLPTPLLRKPRLVSIP